MVKIVCYPVSSYRRLREGCADPQGQVGYKLWKGEKYDVLFLTHKEGKFFIQPEEASKLIKKGCTRLISCHSSSCLPYFENVISIDSHPDLEYNLPTSKKPHRNYSSWLSYSILTYGINAALLGCQQSCSMGEIVFWTEAIDELDGVAFLPSSTIRFYDAEVNYRVKQIKKETQATDELSSKWEKEGEKYEFLKHFKRCLRSLFNGHDRQDPTEFVQEFLEKVKNPERTLLTVDTDGLKPVGGKIGKNTLLDIINLCKSYGVKNFDFAFETQYSWRLYGYIESAIRTINE